MPEGIQHALWMEDATEGWLAATAGRLEGHDVAVLPRNPEEDPLKLADDDLSSISFLHEAAILNCISTRFENGMPYTKCGSHFVAVCPNTPKSGSDTHLRHSSVVEATAESPPAVAKERSASVASYARSVHARLIGTREPQVVFMGGAAGSGKTELALDMIKHLCHCSAVAPWGEDGSTPTGLKLYDQMEAAHTILRSLGCVETRRNRLTSKIGLSTTLKFADDAGVVGASILPVFLESSSVSTPSLNGARNFHIFYELLAGLNDGEREAWKLPVAENARDFWYLSAEGSAGCHSEDGANFQAVRNALKVVNFTKEDQRSIFRALAGILFLGNVTPEVNANGDCTLRDSEALNQACGLLKIDKAVLKRMVCTGEVGPSMLDHAQDLLTVTPKRFQDAMDHATPSTTASMLTPHTGASKGQSRSPLAGNPKDEAVVRRDVLARALYSRILEWICRRVNMLLYRRASVAEPLSLTVVDFPGPRLTETAGGDLEDLCVNYMNERLYNKYLSAIVGSPQALYQEEELQWSKLDVRTNRDVLDLIDGVDDGLFFLLDEQYDVTSSRPPNDADLLEAIVANLGSEMAFGGQRSMPFAGFTVRHTWAPVTYHINGFVKSGVALQTADAMVSKCALPFVTNQRLGGVGSGGQSESHQSIGLMCKERVAMLMQNLSAANVNLVMCISPNDFRAPRQVQRVHVLQQIRDLSMGAVAKMARWGYPLSMEFEDFIGKYGVINKKASSLTLRSAPRLSCQLLLDSISMEQSCFQLGTTRVFVSSVGAAVLSEIETGSATSFYDCDSIAWYRKTLGSTCQEAGPPSPAMKPAAATATTSTSPLGALRALTRSAATLMSTWTSPSKEKGATAVNEVESNNEGAGASTERSHRDDRSVMSGPGGTKSEGGGSFVDELMADTYQYENDIIKAPKASPRHVMNHRRRQFEEQSASPSRSTINAGKDQVSLLKAHAGHAISPVREEGANGGHADSPAQTVLFVTPEKDKKKSAKVVMKKSSNQDLIPSGRHRVEKGKDKEKGRDSDALRMAKSILQERRNGTNSAPSSRAPSDSEDDNPIVVDTAPMDDSIVVRYTATLPDGRKERIMRGVHQKYRGCDVIEGDKCTIM